MFWVISVQFNIRNTLQKSRTFLLGHPVYRTIVLPVGLYECETWSLSLREEQRLRLLKNRALRRLFGPKRNQVIGEWRRLHCEVFNYVHLSPNVIQVIKSRRMR